MLDVGCGWGGFPLWAATKHGASVVGITLSPPQAEEGAPAGRGGRRRRPGRDPGHGLPRPAAAARSSTRSPASAWSSTSARPRSTSTRGPWPGCSSRAGGCSTTASPACATPTPRPGAFSERYVFPDAAPLHLSRNLLALERAGFVIHHVEDFAPDYAETLRHWAPQPRREPRAGDPTRRPGTDPRLAPLPARGPQRLRDGFTSIYQARCTLARSTGRRRSGLPADPGRDRAATRSANGQSGKSADVAIAQSAPASRCSSTE